MGGSLVGEAGREGIAGSVAWVWDTPLLTLSFQLTDPLNPWPKLQELSKEELTWLPGLCDKPATSQVGSDVSSQF